MSDFVHNIKSASYEVIGAGLFITYGSESTTLEIGDPARPLKITLAFEDNKEDKMEVKIDSASETELKFTFYNFNNSLGSGTINPIPIGDINGKVLSFSYRIYRLNMESDQRTIQYTFYRSI